MPTLEDIAPKLAGAKVFSTLDASCGFWQIPLDAASQKLTTLITPMGRFCFRRLPFGITSAPEIFQRQMSTLLKGHDGVVVVMDDILVYGVTGKEHDTRLDAVLKTIKDSGLKLNKAKCHFGKTEIKYFGHIISAESMRPDTDKVKAITRMPSPTNVTELKLVLGLVNYVRKFLPGLSSELHSIDAETSMQEQEGVLKPVAFCSRTLSDAKRYSQIEKECLAGVWACERFARYVQGMESFLLQTDHKPLVPLINAYDLDKVPPRCQRLLMRLLRFNVVAEHVPGKQLIIADPLSRSPLTDSGDEHTDQDIQAYVESVVANAPVSSQKLDKIRSATLEDEELPKIVQFIRNGWPPKTSLFPSLHGYYSARAHPSETDGLVLYQDRLVIPTALRSEVLKQLHEGHQGLTRCRVRARMSVWWPRISAEITTAVSTCKFCIENRRTQRRKPLLTTPLPGGPWQRIAADLCELERQNYLIVTDYYSRDIEIAHLSSTFSHQVITRLKGMFARWGIPLELVSDNATQFTSGEFQDFCQSYGFAHKTTSPHYPQANGAVERPV